MGKSQGWLADTLGITEGAVSRYLSGKTVPRKKYQRRLFKALDMPFQTVEEFMDELGHIGDLLDE